MSQRPGTAHRTSSARETGRQSAWGLASAHWTPVRRAAALVVAFILSLAVASGAAVPPANAAPTPHASPSAKASPKVTPTPTPTPSPTPIPKPADEDSWVNLSIIVVSTLFGAVFLFMIVGGVLRYVKKRRSEH